MRHALAVWLAGLLLAPATAAADGRLVRLPGVHGRLWSSGTELLWESPHHFVRVADARRRVKSKIGIDKRCELAMASRTSLALIVCDSYDADVNDALVLHTRTGEITREPVPGSPLAVGRHWLYSLYNPSGCYHCETYYLTNRRTGRRRFAGDALFQKRGNLDAPDPRTARKTPRRVAHIDGAYLIQRDRRTHRVRRWRLPPRWRSAGVLPVGSNLVLAKYRHHRFGLLRAIPY
jgi:hypothetical protein